MLRAKMKARRPSRRARLDQNLVGVIIMLDGLFFQFS